MQSIYTPLTPAQREILSKIYHQRILPRCQTSSQGITGLNGEFSYCQIWQGATNKRGYGRILAPYFSPPSGPGANPNNVNQPANRRCHQVVWEAFNGFLIPNRWTIDHLCENTACQQADHLEAVPMRVNILRTVMGDHTLGRPDNTPAQVLAQLSLDLDRNFQSSPLFGSSITRRVI